LLIGTSIVDWTGRTARPGAWGRSPGVRPPTIPACRIPVKHDDRTIAPPAERWTSDLAGAFTPSNSAVIQNAPSRLYRTFPVFVLPAQENAQAWRLDYEYLKGTADVLTHQEVNLSPPFSDDYKADMGWVPPADHHWYYHTYRSKSAPGKTVECESLEAEMLARVISATVFITVPDDDASRCSALEARERRLQRRLKTARKGEARARNRLKAARKRVRVANRRLKKKRASGPRAAAIKAEEAKQDAVQARETSRQIVGNKRKNTQETRKTLRDTMSSQSKLCPTGTGLNRRDASGLRSG
jgi:hypothetical protein